MPTGLTPNWRQKASEVHHALIFDDNDKNELPVVGADGRTLAQGKVDHHNAKHDRLLGLDS